MSAPSDSALIAQWQAAWPQALAVWSKFTRLRDPRLCASSVSAAQEGLSGSFAMIRLVDQSVVIDLQSVAAHGLNDYALEILAHEIGHHVLAPGSATDQFRLLARIRRALPTLERHAPLVANLYTDLYINDRLQRQARLRMADIYRQLDQGDGTSADKGAIWALYMRIYEHLWKLDKGSLYAGGAAVKAELDTDAWLGARLIRVYAGDYMAGAGRFATLLLPYLVDDTDALNPARHWQDTRDAAVGSDPYGAQDIEDDEFDGAIHPADDPRISGDGEDEAAAADDTAKTADARGQKREPFEYGAILKAAGIKLSDHDIAVRYYRERALPHLVRFPSRASPESPEPQLEALDPWDIGDPIDDIDWLQTVMQSPQPIPGVTTVRRSYGRSPARTVEPVPVDLDMYVDSSGSMPNPIVQTSYLTLAGAIIALSALRAGSKVKVTLWSGPREHMQTNGFCRDEDSILRVLTGFYGGSTAFPIHALRETYAGAMARPVHILMISDDGITTMFDKDERGNSGWDVAARALAIGRAGGTMALNLRFDLDKEDGLASYYGDTQRDLQRARKEQGWDIHPVTRFEELIAFARAFSERHYADPASKDSAS